MYIFIPLKCYLLCVRETGRLAVGGFLLPVFCCCALAKICAALLVDMVWVLAGLGENIEVGLTFFLTEFIILTVLDLPEIYGCVKSFSYDKFTLCTLDDTGTSFNL